MNGQHFEYEVESFSDPRSLDQITMDPRSLTNQGNSVNGNLVYSNDISNGFGNFDDFTSNTISFETNNLTTPNPPGLITRETPSFNNDSEFTSFDFDFPDTVGFTSHTDITNPSFSATAFSNTYEFPPTSNEVYFNHFPIYGDTINYIENSYPNTAFHNRLEDRTVISTPLNPTNQYLVNFNHIGLTSSNFNNTNPNLVHGYTNMIPPLRSNRGVLPARFDRNFEGYRFTNPEHHHADLPRTRYLGSSFSQTPHSNRYRQPYPTSFVYGNTFGNPYLPQDPQPAGIDEHPTNFELRPDAAFAEFTVNGDFFSNGTHQEHSVFGRQQQQQDDPARDETRSPPAPAESDLTAHRNSHLGAEGIWENSGPVRDYNPLEVMFNAPSTYQEFPPMVPHGSNEFWYAESPAGRGYEQICTQDVAGVWVAPDPVEMSEERAELVYQLGISVNHSEEQGMVPEEWTQAQLWSGSG